MSAETPAHVTAGPGELLLVLGGPPELPGRLQAELPGIAVQTVAGVDALLRLPGHTRPGAAVIVSGNEPTNWAEVLPLLRGHSGLETTGWLLLDRPDQWPALLEAGADVALPVSTPAHLLAAQVQALLRRSAGQEGLRFQLRQVEHALEGWEREERVRDQLVHMLVHDLKNPITAILGLLEVVADDPRLPTDAKELLEVARDETSHLLHLSLNMLDVRKIQAGKMHLKRELLSRDHLEQIVQQALGDVGAGLSDRQLSLQLGAMPPLSADPTMLRRVLANLLSNALKHTTQRGSIWLESRVVGAELHLSVTDNGEGIPAEDIPRLFAAFEQSRLTLHGRFDTGMGLAFCKLAAEEHGGRIWVESERGQGSKFTLALPLGELAEADDDVELLF
ncbi:sensor histidine kinase [Deinococcus sp. SL84]|uniref:sensor histidine kinase n=1 Tax=Deinococcus sp. SL84 TaxID=2994663 RepID=UPI002276BF48|nr:HAMP domain-containing sensor histidine kinase [Deinococcus sp. SL84]MCY1702142.1 HAMP domain-containing sensor histidine kinase [Deinococcus sp. SL84]